MVAYDDDDTKVVRVTKHYEDGKTETWEKVPETSGAGCFIATAAYGTPFATNINILRFWRDTQLKTNFFGNAFISVYYKLSPPIAEFIANKNFLRAAIRAMLTPWCNFLIWSNNLEIKIIRKSARKEN